MTRRPDLRAAPYHADFLQLLRELERASPDKPRIGKAVITRQEVVRLGQDPFMEFPAANVTRFDDSHPDLPPEVRARFLGFFGPQGPLPLLTTVEAMRWQQGNDDSFVRFTDIFATRFLQLFFRAWADARPIVQFDRPAEDRFADFLGSFIGIGTAPYQDRDSVPDIAKLPFAGVLGARVKSARRLEQVLRGLLTVDVTLRERAGMWLEFEDADLTRMGQATACLGRNTYAGRRVYSINDKAVIEIRTRSLEEYRRFLPGGPMFARLADVVALYLGNTVEFEVELALPADQRPAAQLGRSGHLGWTAWPAPAAEQNRPPAPAYVSDAKFALRRSG